MLQETHVVTCFLRNRGEVLLLRRSDEVGSYPDKWGGVAGHAEGNPDSAARQEIKEDTGLNDAVTFVRKGTPFPVEDKDLGTRWIVHPYLFDCTRRDVRLDRESTEAVWVSPTEILRRDTVPELWASYAQVAPTVDTIREDREHGAAYLSIRALEALRDWAGRIAWQEKRGNQLDIDKAWQSIEDLARRLLSARSSMAVLQNRMNRVMHACRTDRTAAAVEKTAHETLRRALEADDEAARHVADVVAGRRVLTLSRSGTVEAALREAAPAPSVVVAESRPDREGVGVAERLSKEGLDVTLITDAALAHMLIEEDVDLVLTGADTVLPSGAVVNKTGTCLAALAARYASVPFYAVCASDKVYPDDRAELEEGPPEAVYEGAAALRVLNPTFEVTPADLVAGVITERGTLAPSEVHEVADELRALAAWQK